MAGFSQSERRGLQRLQLGRPSSPSAGSETVHPDADLLTAFAEHSLTAREHDQVLGHLGACASCREVVALAGTPLMEPVPEPARKRGIWEMPLFHWGAVAATTVIVVAAVSLGVREYRTETPQMSRVYKEQPAPMVAEREDKVVAEPETKIGALQASSPATPPASAAQPKRSLHLQQQARYERPSNETAKKQEIAASTNGRNVHAITAAGAPVADTSTRDFAYSANANAVLKNKAADMNTAAVPPPPPPPGATLAQNAPVSGASEMVTVERGNSEVKTDQSASATAQITPQSAVTDDKVQGYAGAPVQKAARAKVSEFRWQISDGKLQRSAAPNEWHSVLPNQTFRTFAVVERHVWAGGDNGLLYHSADNGQTWAPISVKTGTIALTGSVMVLRFTDVQRGSLHTSTGETWSTSDGGQSWEKQ